MEGKNNMNLQEIISISLIALGIIFLIFGTIAMFRFKDFYPRILTATKVDTVGMITLLVGLSVRHGLSFFTLKLILIMIIIFILNPLVAHVVARSAYICGDKLKGEMDEESAECCEDDQMDWCATITDEEGGDA